MEARVPTASDLCARSSGPARFSQEARRAVHSRTSLRFPTTACAPRAPTISPSCARGRWGRAAATGCLASSSASSLLARLSSPFASCARPCGLRRMAAVRTSGSFARMMCSIDSAFTGASVRSGIAGGRARPRTRYENELSDSMREYFCRHVCGLADAPRTCTPDVVRHVIEAHLRRSPFARAHLAPAHTARTRGITTGGGLRVCRPTMQSSEGDDIARARNEWQWDCQQSSEFLSRSSATLPHTPISSDLPHPWAARPDCSPAMWATFLLSDLLAMDARLRHPNPRSVVRALSPPRLCCSLSVHPYAQRETGEHETQGATAVQRATAVQHDPLTR